MNAVVQPYLYISQGGPTWTQVRKGRIGASQVASAANVEGAYVSRGRLWDTIKGFHEDPANPALEWGTRMEPEARKSFERLFGETIQLGIVMDSDDRKCCSPDGIWEDDDGLIDGVPGPWVVEYKCPFTCQVYPDVPMHHQAQLLSLMRICDVPRALYCVWVPHLPLAVWRVAFCPQQSARLEVRVDDFLEEFVEKNVRPPKSKPGTKLRLSLPRVKLPLCLCIPNY
jgi:hypothetical protein